MSNFLGEIANRAKHLVVEEDVTPTPPVHVPAAGISHPAFNLPSTTYPSAPTASTSAPSGSPFSVGTTPVLDEKVYQSVLGKTNFDTTPVGKIVHRYYDALDGVIPDSSQRFKAAIGQAQKIDNITPGAIIGTFDQLQAALESDAHAFQAVADGVQANQITARQNKIADLQHQADIINSQIAQLNTELVSETANHANAVQQYGLAEQRRALEITQQKAQFAALLNQ